MLILCLHLKYVLLIFTSNILINIYVFLFI